MNQKSLDRERQGWHVRARVRACVTPNALDDGDLTTGSQAHLAKLQQVLTRDRGSECDDRLGSLALAPLLNSGDQAGRRKD